MNEDAGKVDFGAIMARVSRNRDALDACPRHLFPSEVPGMSEGVGAMLGRKLICKRCEGELDLVNVNQYIRGYEAGGGNGNDILPGWKPYERPQRKFFGQETE